MVLEVMEEIMIWIGTLLNQTREIQKFSELFHKLNPDVL
jgi:hypothetical protein